MLSSVSTKIIRTWDEFRAVAGGGEHSLWRGQADCEWPLASSLERIFLERIRKLGKPLKYPYGDAFSEQYISPEWHSSTVQGMREQYLRRFQDLAVGLRGSWPIRLDPEEWWAIGRHHGLISPALDWTEKPFIAAFFAAVGFVELHGHPLQVDHHPERRAAVFHLTNSTVSVPGMTVKRLRIDELPRLHAQYGAFTFHEDVGFFELEGLLEQKGPAPDLLHKYELGPIAISQGLIDMERHGISYRSLFPYLTGAALEANRYLSEMAEALAEP